MHIIKLHIRSSFKKYIPCYYFSGPTASRFVHFATSTNTSGKSGVHVKKNQNFYLLPVRHGKIFLFFDMMLHLVLMIPILYLNVHFTCQYHCSTHTCNHSILIMPIWILKVWLYCTLLKSFRSTQALPYCVDWMVLKKCLYGFPISSTYQLL